MGRKHIDGFTFETFVGDHPPYHVHIKYGRRELGRFDIENQKSMDKGLKISGKLRRALKKGGYLL